MQMKASHLGDFTLRPRALLIAALAIPVGIASSLTAYLLLKLIGLITNLVFYQRLDTELVAPGAQHHPWWLILSAPIVGGLIIGLMARYGSEKIRGHGMPEALEAIVAKQSRVQPRVAVLKPVSSAVALGTGGPFGAEGPIIMTGGAVGSVIAQLLKLSSNERKALLVAGAAGGMAAVFNAPLASILLAVELLLFEWKPRSFIPVTLSVVVSTSIRGFLLGTAPLFPVDVAVAPSTSATALAAITGVTGGLFAVVVTWLVYRSEDAFAKLPFHWMWWPALGGVIIGIGGLIEPRALGVGYEVIEAMLTGHATVALIFGILTVKTLIWGLSIGSGTSAGVLAPVFLLGSALGAAEGLVLPEVFPGFWAMCGLAAVVGGVMRCPLTGIVFTMELTQAWDCLVPLTVASVVAYGVSALILKRSILTEKLARRKLHLTREYSTDPLEALFVHEVMSPEPAVLAADAVLADVRGTTRHGELYPVVDGTRLIGTTTHEALTACPGEVVAEAATAVSAVIHPDDTLRTVAELLAVLDTTHLPVVDRDDPTRVRGVVGLTQLLRARKRGHHEEHHRQRYLATT
ncbi:chloride channel protein [Saccharopolyspora flava]|uniref:H+/Cl-antiporter ClcA n=1 Tax=Saccharopolyspora flava TaxID=95161 RepID=A0A1I6T079_9PSEU|nr:chloride channel protein [Saccharopolyspora flava]SFS82644.1 H+/Cl-antiporter ClcA [Saccharopolyspora flava]